MSAWAQQIRSILGRLDQSQAIKITKLSFRLIIMPFLQIVMKYATSFLAAVSFIALVLRLMKYRQVHMNVHKGMNRYLHKWYELTWIRHP